MQSNYLNYFIFPSNKTSRTFFYVLHSLVSDSKSGIALSSRGGGTVFIFLYDFNDFKIFPNSVLKEEKRIVIF